MYQLFYYAVSDEIVMDFYDNGDSETLFKAASMELESDDIDTVTTELWNAYNGVQNLFSDKVFKAAQEVII